MSVALKSESASFISSRLAFFTIFTVKPICSSAVHKFSASFIGSESPEKCEYSPFAISSAFFASFAKRHAPDKAAANVKTSIVFFILILLVVVLFYVVL